jgi:hypothetical protein
MARKRPKVSKQMLFIWFMLAGFILLLAPQNLTNKFHFAFARLFRWPLSVGRNISLSAQTPQKPEDLFRQKESQYQNHIANLEQELFQTRQKFEEVSQIRQRRPLDGASLALADIIRANIEGSHNELIINRGQDDGLAIGQFVLGDNSIIGMISDVSSRTARVKLITDSTSKIAVKIEGLDIGRIMTGAGGNSAKIRLLKNKVKSGTKIYADKKPGYLDAPMVTAVVTGCRANDENPLLWDIIVTAACKIGLLNDVAVIVLNSPAPPAPDARRGGGQDVTGRDVPSLARRERIPN